MLEEWYWFLYWAQKYYHVKNIYKIQFAKENLPFLAPSTLMSPSNQKFVFEQDQFQESFLLDLDFNNMEALALLLSHLVYSLSRSTTFGGSCHVSSFEHLENCLLLLSFCSSSIVPCIIFLLFPCFYIFPWFLFVVFFSFIVSGVLVL